MLKPVYCALNFASTKLAKLNPSLAKSSSAWLGSAQQALLVLACADLSSFDTASLFGAGTGAGNLLLSYAAILMPVRAGIKQ